MKYFLYLFLVFIVSCKSNNPKNNDNSLKTWILTNQRQIMLTSDSVFQRHQEQNAPDTNWFSFTIAMTKFAPNIFGKLAEKAGDSTDCIIIEQTFYKDVNKKREIMIAAMDSTCLLTLRNITLNIDSTDDFIYGKKQ